MKIDTIFKQNVTIYEKMKNLQFTIKNSQLSYSMWSPCGDKFLTTYGSAPFGAEILQIFTNRTNI